MSVRADAETLRNIPIFAECDPVELQVLAFSSERRQFAAGDSIIIQGEQGDYAALILDGQTDVQHDGGRGASVIGTAGPGAMLGEVAMIGGVAYSVTAVAKTPVSAACITRSLFMRVAAEYPDFGASVLKALAQRFAGSMSDLTGVQDTLNRTRTFSDL